MREAFVRGISDEYRLHLGYGANIVCAVMNLPQCRQGEPLEYIAEVSGKELIGFIERHASELTEHIPEIKEDYRYQIIAWDW